MKLKELNLKYSSRTILDSRGNPTSEVDILYKDQIFRSSCPAGASTGSNECVVITDNRTKYNGKNIDNVHNIIKNVIIPLLQESEVDATNSLKVDELLLGIDKSKNKQNIGVNSILPLSLSFCKLGAYLNEMTLYEYIGMLYGSKPKIPVPHFNVLNGGQHSGNNFEIQEIMIAFQSTDINENIENASVFYHELKKKISSIYGSSYTSVGDEGGFAPPIKSIEEAIDLLIDTGNSCGRTNFKIAIDVAANSFYENGYYHLNQKKLSNEQLADYYMEIINEYSQVYSIEDPFAEEDIEGWEHFAKRTPKGFNIVGDDLTVTNTELIKKAYSKKLCNVLLVKPNQIGTVAETLEAVRTARSYNMKIMVSHRSGETEDTFISDLAVGLGADYIKSGAPCRGERVAKYNQLMRINETLEK